MMTYKLRCAAGHGFEGWFRSSEDFDSQAERSLLSCPICGNSEIEKAIMAPAVVTSRQKAKPPVLPAKPDKDKTDESSSKDTATETNAVPVPAEPRQEILPAVTAHEERTAKLLGMMRQIQAHVEKNFENVGKRFPEEARKMHLGETEHRDVYGQASLEEAKELLEEGVPVLPLPKLPKLDG